MNNCWRNIPAGLYDYPTEFLYDTSTKIDRTNGAILFSENWRCTRSPIKDRNGDDLLLNWEDTHAYIAALRAETGLNLRLPTEAEWYVFLYAIESRGRWITFHGTEDHRIALTGVTRKQCDCLLDTPWRSDGIDFRYEEVYQRKRPFHVVENSGIELFCKKDDLFVVNQINTPVERWPTRKVQIEKGKKTSSYIFHPIPTFTCKKDEVKEGFLRERLPYSWDLSYAELNEGKCFDIPYHELRKRIGWIHHGILADSCFETGGHTKIYHWKESEEREFYKKEGFIIWVEERLFSVDNSYESIQSRAIAAWALCEKDDTGVWFLSDCGSGIESEIPIHQKPDNLSPHWFENGEEEIWGYGNNRIYTQGPMYHALLGVKEFLDLFSIETTPQWSSLVEKAKKVEVLGWTQGQRVLFSLYKHLDWTDQWEWLNAEFEKRFGKSIFHHVLDSRSIRFPLFVREEKEIDWHSMAIRVEEGRKKLSSQFHQEIPMHEYIEHELLNIQEYHDTGLHHVLYSCFRWQEIEHEINAYLGKE